VHKIDLLDVDYEIYWHIMYHHMPYDQITKYKLWNLLTYYVLSFGKLMQYKLNNLA